MWCLCALPPSAQFKTDIGELEELRELKADIQRREHTQANVIASQAKQLRELETLYKDELLQRRRYHNMLEDMKVCGNVQRNQMCHHV